MGIKPRKWIERLHRRIEKLCLSHNYISTFAVFIGLTSLSTYSFDNQRISPQKTSIRTKVARFSRHTFLSYALKESRVPVSCDVLVVALTIES